MDPTSKKAAVAAYKKRKTAAGIYMLRCADAGRTWVGYAPDLGTVMNRMLFTLRAGSHRSTELQAAWNRFGADCLAFEQVESFEPEEIPLGEALKARLAHWRRELGALPA